MGERETTRRRSRFAVFAVLAANQQRARSRFWRKSGTADLLPTQRTASLLLFFAVTRCFLQTPAPEVGMPLAAS
jgi:hypothetical protein